MSPAPASLLPGLLAALPPDAPVLDAGGWYRPLSAATHVADLMPYQTRRGELRLEPLPGERFRAATWHLGDFAAANFRLPVPDGFFAFAFCGQTVEDLEDPEPLLRELRRVARAGLIESPSRLAEQTIGVRDRVTGRAGHPHHRWILDPQPGVLELAPKAALAGLPRRRHGVPLRTLERLAPSRGLNCSFRWEGSFAWRILVPAEAAARATAFRQAQGVTVAEELFDPLVRRLRGWKRALQGRPRDDPTAWWEEMTRISRPFLTESR